MDTANEKKQMLTVDSRKRMELDGVKNVAAFTDDYMELDTELGALTVEGEELKILELSREDGRIVVTGNICGIFYGAVKSTKGLFGKIFK